MVLSLWELNYLMLLHIQANENKSLCWGIVRLCANLLKKGCMYNTGCVLFNVKVKEQFSRDLRRDSMRGVDTEESGVTGRVNHKLHLLQVLYRFGFTMNWN